MNKQDISLLYKYNKWANNKIMNAASDATHEQFIAPAAFPHGGLRGTLRQPARGRLGVAPLGLSLSPHWGLPFFVSGRPSW
jgi:hypothetical protein